MTSQWPKIIDRSSKDLPSIYLRFTFNLPSIYIQEHHFWTFTLWMSTFILPSIYLQLTFILHWLTFNLPSHFWSKYFYIQLTINLHWTRGGRLPKNLPSRDKYLHFLRKIRIWPQQNSDLIENTKIWPPKNLHRNLKVCIAKFVKANF